MGTQLNLNTPPYYDDYNARNDYYQLLFQPGRPVQARELTGMQSMFQNQVSTLASRFLHEGDNIVPGEFGFDKPIPYVRVSSITQGSSAADFIGYTLTGVTSGVKAKVLFALDATETDDTTFYVTYTNSGNNSDSVIFTQGETVTSDTPQFYTATVGIEGISKPTTSSPMGAGSLAHIEEGYFFVDGFMVRNEAARIAVDKYGVTPSKDVGFIVTEQTINSSEDSTLLDNATGASNFAAPGADRLRITLTFSVKDPSTILPNFIPLMTIIQGNVQGRPQDQIKWRWLYDLLAARTFDESGDYIVTEFPINLMEYANVPQRQNIGRVYPGLYNASADGTYPALNTGEGKTRYTLEEADEWYVLEVGAGKAYVQGYQAEYKDSIFLYGPKSRDEGYRSDSTTSISEGFNLSVTHSYGTPDLENIVGVANADALNQITLYRNFADGFVGEATKSGSLEPINFGNAPWVTYHIVTDVDITNIDDAAYTVIYKQGNSAVVTGTTDLKRGSSFGAATVLISVKVNPIPSGVLTPRYYIPENQINDQDGTFGYDSSDKLGIVTSTFFTELPVVPLANAATEWVVGDVVVGDASRASGTVEIGTVNDQNVPANLIVSNINGEFRPGETITQGTGATQKVSRILSPGETFQLQFYTGAGGSVTGSTDLSGENYIDITTLGATIRLTKDTDYTATSTELYLNATGRTKLFNFPFPAGSELAVERLNMLVTTEAGALGFAVLLPGALTNTLTKTKSMFSDLAGYDKFAADISSQNRKDTEVVELASNALFTGQSNNNFLECDNFAGDPSSQLGFGDIITFVDDTGAAISKMVYFSTAPVGRTTARAKSRIYFTTTLTAGVTGKTCQRIRIKTRGRTSQNLIFQLPQAICKSLETNPDATGIDYEVYREFILEVEANATDVVIQVPGDSNVNVGTIESFLDNPDNISIAVIKNLSDPLDTANLVGRFLTINEDYNTGSYSRGVLLQDNDTKISMRLGYSNIPKIVVKVIIPLKVRNALAKRKVLRSNVDVIIDASTAAQEVIPLGLADVFRINEIKDNVTEQSLLQNYVFDNGQRDAVYDISRLITANDRPRAQNAITVNLDYFSHEGGGDFFSVDSYTHDEGISYKEIPDYQPTGIIPAESIFTPVNTIQLRDCADFRPVVNTLATGSGAVPSLLSPVTPGLCTQGTADGSRQSDTNFLGGNNNGNGFVPSFPIPKTRFECNIQYYLSRVDSVYLDKSGQILLLRGSPGDFPRPPAGITTGIRLYDLYVPPYTFSVKDITNRKYNYKRYRMKDIASIDRRVSAVEELVTLSILEQSALNMAVRDSITGLDRFKNGIVVDNFANHGKGNVGQPQYRNAIDPKTTQLRSAGWVNQVNLSQRERLPVDQFAQGYMEGDGIATVNYTNYLGIDQPFATRSINLQAYFVFTWDGQLQLFPNIDTFDDAFIQPDLVIQDDQLYNSMIQLNEWWASTGLASVWTDWEETGNVDTTVNNTVTQVPARSQTTQSGRVITTTNFAASTLFTTTTTTATELNRQLIQNQFTPGTGQQIDTSYGERVVDVQLARTMRSVPVYFAVQRVKPNTRYYLFFDEVGIDDWCSPDNPIPGTDFPDGRSHMPDVPGTRQKGFGADIISDDNGNITGCILIPSGLAPTAGTTFTTLEDVSYDATSLPRTFRTGTRNLRFTSHPTNAEDAALIEGYAEASFYSTGILTDRQSTIVSTRAVDIQQIDVVVNEEFREDIEVDVQVRQEGGQVTGRTSVTIPPPRPPIIWRPPPRPVVFRGGDPIAQSFEIQESNHPEGVFVTELEVFLETVDDEESLMGYLVSTDAQVPTEQILPHGKVTVPRNSNIRTQVTLPTGVDTVTLPAGSIITGTTTGATGIVKSEMTFNSAVTDATQNTSNFFYNVLLSNYTGDFTGETAFSVTTDNVNLKNTLFAVPANEVHLQSVEMVKLGSGYSQPDTTVDGEVATTVTISAPDLIGGVNATATVKVSRSDMPLSGSITADGLVYEITLTNPGSGYTKAPSVTINGDGSNATAIAVVEEGTPTITMGVAFSSDASQGTKFRFPAPVYMLPNNYYAFVIKTPKSLDYRMYTAQLGENIIGTDTRMTEQPNLGSLFMSQNGGLWTENQTQDVMFNLYMAEFDVNNSCEITLQNDPLTLQTLTSDPIETSNNAAVSEDDIVFGSNPKIVRIQQAHHGLVAGDLVAIQGVVGYGTPARIGGIDPALINTLHMVQSASIDYYTIKVTGTGATQSVTGGGSNVKASFNMPYECTCLRTGLQTFGTSVITSYERTTQAEAVTGFNKANAYTLDADNAVVLADTYYYNGPKQVPSHINEMRHSGTFQMNGKHGYELKVYMVTGNSDVSPVFDIRRTNLIAIRNLIDNPKPTDEIFGTQETTLTLNDVDLSAVTLTSGDTLDFSNTVNSITTARKARIKDYNTTTKRMVIEGAFAREFEKSSTITDTNLASVGVLSATSSEGYYYIPETSNDGSVFSKWESRLFEFENPCDGIELKLTACFYGNVVDNDNGTKSLVSDNIRVYYRPRNIGFDSELNTENWVPFNETGLPNNVEQIVPRSTAEVNPNRIRVGDWQDLTWNIQDIPLFDAIAIKIVMVSDNPALAPLIDDFRMICSE
jgi:hypothetical protein